LRRGSQVEKHGANRQDQDANHFILHDKQERTIRIRAGCARKIDGGVPLRISD
jgi:hypothetical protein